MVLVIFVQFSRTLSFALNGVIPAGVKVLISYLIVCVQVYFLSL